MPDTDPPTQLQWFQQAVQLLGGQRATARYLNIGERNVRYILAGERTLHDGILRETAAALIDHAAKCRTLEQKLFSAAIKSADPQAKPDRRRFDHREQD